MPLLRVPAPEHVDAERQAATDSGARGPRVVSGKGHAAVRLWDPEPSRPKPVVPSAKSPGSLGGRRSGAAE